MAAPKILAFSGSLRSESYNKKLVHIAAQGAREAGAEVTEIELRDFALPLYDGDLEEREGIPARVHELRGIFRAHQGLLISSCEHNSSYSAALKNAIDWLSRPVPDEPTLAAFDGKIVGLLAASPGALGGMRGLVSLRMLLGNLRMMCLYEQLALPKADEAFDESGQLKDPKQQKVAESIGSKLTEVLRKHHSLG